MSSSMPGSMSPTVSEGNAARYGNQDQSTGERRLLSTSLLYNGAQRLRASSSSRRRRTERGCSRFPLSALHASGQQHFFLYAAIFLLAMMSQAESADVGASQQTLTPVPANSNDDISVLAAVVASLGFVWMLLVLGLTVRIAGMCREFRMKTMPATPTTTTTRTGNSRLSRRSGSMREAQSSAGTSGSLRAPSRTGSLGGAGGSVHTVDCLQTFASQTASNSSNWRPVIGNGGGGGPAGLMATATSVSNSGGSGQGSGQSLRGFSFGPAVHAQRQQSQGSQSATMTQRSIIQLAQEVTARGRTWHQGQGKGNPPGLSNLVGPAVVHQQPGLVGAQNTLSRPIDLGYVGACATATQSPFFTPQSPDALSKVEMLSPGNERPIALQPLSFGTPSTENAGAGAGGNIALLPSPLANVSVNNYANDVVRVNSERRGKLSLPLAQSAAVPPVITGEDGNDGAGGGGGGATQRTTASARSPQYLPTDSNTMKPVNSVEDNNQQQQQKETDAAATAAAAAQPIAAVVQASQTVTQPGGGEMLTPLGFPSTFQPLHEQQPSVPKSLKDQYASYEDMRHPHSDRRSSVSSRHKHPGNSSSHGGGGGADSPSQSGEKAPRISLPSRLSAHFTKPGGILMMLPGRGRHSQQHNGAKETKADQSPQASTPTGSMAPGSLATPNDHLREASIASAASLPLPGDQQRYVPFPITNSPYSNSHSLAMQMEASSQDLSPGQNKALDL